MHGREVFPSRDAGQPPVPLRLADQLGWDSLSVIVCAPGHTPNHDSYGYDCAGMVIVCAPGHTTNHDPQPLLLVP